MFLLLLVPLWRDRENALFVVEPMHSVTLHAAVNGRVNAVLVREGESVSAGQPLLRMSSTTAAAMGSAAVAQTGRARFEIFAAELSGRSIGKAAAEQEAAIHSTGLAREAQSSLVVLAPSDGIVLTPNPDQLLDQDIGSGQPMLTIADSKARTVRIFIPVSALDHVPEGTEVTLVPPGSFSVIRMKLATIEGDAVNLPAGLGARQEYKGAQLPTYYCARMPLPASGDDLPLGTTGTAKIFGARRSLFGRIALAFLNLVRAHVW
jgi:hypothetical protein